MFLVVFWEALPPLRFVAFFFTILSGTPTLVCGDCTSVVTAK